mmetsp:Transcript_25344/g.101034  ORF Transcript_25344/g.101034 Transcript_25344/m.101034 type:complete len:745 (-) Transcript_25344:854-3088(-)
MCDADTVPSTWGPAVDATPHPRVGDDAEGRAKQTESSGRWHSTVESRNSATTATSGASAEEALAASSRTHRRAVVATPPRHKERGPRRAVTRTSCGDLFCVAAFFVVAIATMVTPARGQEFVSYTGTSCVSTDPGSQATCFLLEHPGDDGESEDGDEGDEDAAIRSACWTYCRDEQNAAGELEASFAAADNATRTLTCCCALTCSCLLDDPQDTLLAVSTRIGRPPPCFGGGNTDPDEPGEDDEPGSGDDDPPGDDVDDNGDRTEDPPLDPAYDVLSDTTCAATSALHCWYDETLATPLACSDLCFSEETSARYGTNVTAAVTRVGVNPYSGRGEFGCCCYDDCECVADEVFPDSYETTTVIVRDEAAIPYQCRLGIEIGDDPDPIRYYARVDCGDVGSSARGIRVTYDETASPSTKWADACWGACDAVYAPEYGRVVAALAVPSEGACWCYAECGCLEYIPHVPDTTTGIEGRYLALDNTLDVIDCDAVNDDDPNQGGDDPPIGDVPFEDLDALYWGSVGLECGTEHIPAEDKLCFYDMQYYEDGDLPIWRYQCWAYCAHWYAASFGGALAAAYGDPSEGECCCVTACPCFATTREPDTVIALAPDWHLKDAGGSSLVSRNATDDDGLLPPSDNGTTTTPVLPLMCPTNEQGKKKKKRLAPGVDTSDLWWIVLIAIMGAVAITFFLLVEEVDKHRRQKHAEARRSGTQVAKPEGWVDDDDDDDDAPLPPPSRASASTPNRMCS